MNIIGLVGKKEAGKTTFAEFIREELREKKPEIVNLRFSFGDALKQMLIEAEICHHSDLFEKKTIYSRIMMQKIGTEIVRKVDPDYWCKQVWERLKSAMLMEPDCVVVIDDVRFMNEANMIESLGGMLVKIIRNGETPDSHRSETEQGQICPGVMIYNTSDLANLKKAVPGIIASLHNFLTTKSRFTKEITKTWRSEGPQSKFLR